LAYVRKVSHLVEMSGFPDTRRDAEEWLKIYTSRGAGSKVGLYRTSITGGPPELVVDLAPIRQTGWWGFYFGLDPDDAPLLLRNAGAYEIYALNLE
jgi:hypothetical protein